MTTHVCPVCGRKLPLPDDPAGKRVECPHCGAHIQLAPAGPTPSAAPPHPDRRKARR